MLLPGNYVDIRIGKREKRLLPLSLVPQAALAQDEHGNYVMTVDKDNIARETRVVIGNTMEDKQIVKDGLKPEDRVIIRL